MRQGMMPCHHGVDGVWITEECTRGLVTIVVPTFNRSDVLHQTLECVWRQSHRPIEMLIVDDGSTDDTEQVIRAFQRQTDLDFALRYFRQERAGAPAARNRGCLESRGEYIQFLDSDDTFVEGKLREQVRALSANTSVDAAYGPWRCYYEDRTAKYGPRKQLEAMATEDSMLRGYVSGRWFCPIHSYLFRRRVVAATGPWDETLRQRQDADYVFRVLLLGFRFVHVAAAEVFYHRHAGDHVGHPARFRRHFGSQLQLIRKQHVAFHQRERDRDYADEFISHLSMLDTDAAVMGHREGRRHCAALARELFGSSNATIGRHGLRWSLGVLAKRFVGRPLHSALGEYHVMRTKALLVRLATLTGLHRRHN